MTISTDLQPTDECIAIDRFGTTLTDAEKAHVEICTRCEAELALWHEFTDSKPTADEGAAVQWIVAELRRRTAAGRAPAPARAGGWLSSLRLRVVMGPAAAAAAAMLAVGVFGYLAWDPEPRIGPSALGEPVYRTVTVQVVAPTGDVHEAPAELAWVAVDGAARYEVQVLEIDRTVLWRTTSVSQRVLLPSSLVEQIVPGKTLLWEVTALDGSGTSIATSGPQRFRVPITTTSGRR